MLKNYLLNKIMKACSNPLFKLYLKTNYYKFIKNHDNSDFSLKFPLSHIKVIRRSLFTIFIYETKQFWL